MKKNLVINSVQIKGWLFLALLGFAYFLITSYFATPLTLLLASIGLVLVAVIFIKPWIGTYIIVASFPFIVSIPRGTYLPGLKFDEILIILVLVLHFISPNKKKNLKLYGVDYLFIILLLSGFVIPSFGLAVRGWEINLIEFGTLFKPYFVFRLVLFTMDDIRKIRNLIILLLLPIFLVCFIAILQIMNMGDIRSQLASIYFDSATTVLVNEALTASQLSLRLRATSTLGQWNALGGYSALAACLSLAFIPHSRALRPSWLPALGFTASLMSLILTGSSNSMVGFSIGLVAWWFLQGKNFLIRGNIVMRKRLLISFILMVILVSVGYVFAGKSVIDTQIARQSATRIYDRATREYYSTYGIPSSLVVRWYLAKYLLGQMSADEWAPLTGFGVSPATDALLPWGSAESGYMHMLFYFGPVFLFLYFFLLWVIFRVIWKFKLSIKLSNELGNGLATASLLFILVMVILNIVQSGYTGAGVMHIFWIVIACCLSLIAIRNNGEKVLVN